MPPRRRSGHPSGGASPRPPSPPAAKRSRSPSPSHARTSPPKRGYRRTMLPDQMVDSPDRVSDSSPKAKNSSSSSESPLRPGCLTRREKKLSHMVEQFKDCLESYRNRDGKEQLKREHEENLKKFHEADTAMKDSKGRLKQLNRTEFQFFELKNLLLNSTYVVLTNIEEAEAVCYLKAAKESWNLKDIIIKKTHTANDQAIVRIIRDVANHYGIR